MKRARRATLIAPASSGRKLEKARASGADVVVVDLEDSVAPEEKVEARGLAREAVRVGGWGRSEVGVRVNGLDTIWALEDICEVVRGCADGLDFITLPKTREVGEVEFMDRLLGMLERGVGVEEGKVKLDAQVEDVEALSRVEELARAGVGRLRSLTFGPGDYAASQGAEALDVGVGLSGGEDLWRYPRERMVVAARAAGLDAIDGPYADFRDEEGLRRESTRARMMGYAGKWVIHPDQIAPCTESFTPSLEATTRAREIIAAYDEALKGGRGAVATGGMMVDAASARMAREVLARAGEGEEGE